MTHRTPIRSRRFRSRRLTLSAGLLLTLAAAAQKGSAPVAPHPTGGSGTTSGSGGTGSGTRSSNNPYNTNPYNTGPYSAYPGTDIDQRLEDSRTRAREADRQKRMVEDANRLVTLAARYRASVSEHGSPTTEDARLLVDMEKLARSVKERMKGM